MLDPRDESYWADRRAGRVRPDGSLVALSLDGDSARFTAWEAERAARAEQLLRARIEALGDMPVEGGLEALRAQLAQLGRRAHLAREVIQRDELIAQIREAA